MRGVTSNRDLGEGKGPRGVELSERSGHRIPWPPRKCIGSAEVQARGHFYIEGDCIELRFEAAAACDVEGTAVIHAKSFSCSYSQ